MADRHLDVIYVAASAHDARLTRICVASIRWFYPDAPVKLLPGGPLEPALVSEMAKYWNVGVADIPTGDWGWGFVKLQPLFGRPGERFMVVDSDTAFAGQVLGKWLAADADFLVDKEEQSQADLHRLYYDWTKVAQADPAARPPAFVFNSGQWFGTAGIVSRQDFALLIDWSGMPPELKLGSYFMPGDQGVLNYVLNQKAVLHGLKVARDKIMHWPGHGMDSFGPADVAARRTPDVVIHWAGLKAARLGAMPRPDLLKMFEFHYYSRVPRGRALRLGRALRYSAAAIARNFMVRVRQRLHRRKLDNK